MRTVFQRIVVAVVVLIGVAGCMTPVYHLPVRTATVVDVHTSMREVVRPNGIGALVGALIGGAAGNQVGKGGGRKLATAAGLAAGAVAGASMGAEKSYVSTSYIVMRDDESGEFFNVTFDGAWKSGMKVRYSNQGGRFVFR